MRLRSGMEVGVVSVAAYGLCTDTYILANNSTQIPLVPRLDFDQHLVASDDRLDPGSGFFLLGTVPHKKGSVQSYTTFYGSITLISVNVPEPPSLTILLSGFAMLLLGTRLREMSR
jgi:hypothetical protein